MTRIFMISKIDTLLLGRKALNRGNKALQGMATDARVKIYFHLQSCFFANASHTSSDKLLFSFSMHCSIQ